MCIHVSREMNSKEGAESPEQFGSEYFQTPFVDAHEQTSSILPAATRWNGISFSNHGGGGSYGTGELNPGDYDDSGDN